MTSNRLIEPQALLFGPEAAVAVKAGVALPLAGGSTAFALVTLIDGQSRSGPLPVDRIPAGWAEELRRVTIPVSRAGMPAGAQVMAILNVTPDSFSDGGRHHDPARAVAAGEDMIRAGVGVIDIGAESTRPGSEPVSPQEEWTRLAPVVTGLAGRGAVLSIDTRNARTMEAALDAGADVINDVSALAHDPDALSLLASRECPVVLMHMRGEPGTMNRLTRYGDVAVDVVRELEARIAEAERAGIARSRLLIDPGIGFAKNTAQNCVLLRRLPLFANLGCRMVLGVSRKRMIGELAEVPVAASRDPGTIVASLPGLALPGTVLRVHDYRAMVQAMRVWEGCFTPPQAVD